MPYVQIVLQSFFDIKCPARRDTLFLMERFSLYAPAVLRVGSGLVLLWFGASQLTTPSEWVAWLPAWTLSLPFGETALILANGAFEALLSVLLIAGFQTRLAAALLFLHTTHVMTMVGYNDIGVRDFGIAIAFLSIFLHGPDHFTLDARNSAPPALQ